MILGFSILGIIIYKEHIFTNIPHQRDLGTRIYLKRFWIVLRYAGYLAISAAVIGYIKHLSGVYKVPANQDVINQIAHKGSLPLLIIGLLTAPVFEEIIFRWFIFEKLFPKTNRIYPTIFAIIAFTLPHLLAGSLTDLSSIASYGTMSIIITYAYFKYGDVRLTIGIHFLWNLIATFSLLAIL